MCQFGGRVINIFLLLTFQRITCSFYIIEGVCYAVSVNHLAMIPLRSANWSRGVSRKEASYWDWPPKCESTQSVLSGRVRRVVQCPIWELVRQSTAKPPKKKRKCGQILHSRRIR